MSSGPAHSHGVDVDDDNYAQRSPRRIRVHPRLPEAGETIAGKYLLVRLIGEGGMGVVFEATHVRLRQRLAIKILRPDLPELGDVLARFEREARAAAQLRSIHVARVIDVDTLLNGLPYIVLEYLEGRDLDAELGITGPMAVEDAVDIVLQTAEPMSEAHALGIIHRDLKPANLFLCRAHDSTSRIVKVLDFGISKSEREDSRLTPSHAYFGTPCYAAPEQLREATAADARSDVWSLGAILFELLTGRTPFVGLPTEVIAKVVSDSVPSPIQLRPDLPPDLARVVLRALAKDPDRRFQSMRQLSEALAPFGPKKDSAALMSEAPRSRGKLGEILVAEGLLARGDLQCALAEQRRSGVLLGRVLLDMGFVAEPDLLTALAKQQGIIVTPEPPLRTHGSRPAVRAAHPASARPRSRASVRRMWFAAAAGLPLGILLAVAVATLVTKGRSSSPPSPVSVAPIASATPEG
ncbi:MAG: protein kinase, partial [Myxococcota bacterium]|nr:protein kinase [Myxococcota bacterium]